MTPNDSSKFYECCIIGAGPAGLGAALELVRNGHTDIIIIDKNDSVGGLSRTHFFEGARFDIGPHRFFSKNKEVNEIWHSSLGADYRSVSRLTRIFYKNKYFYYPIKTFDILTKLGFKESLKIILSSITSQIKRTDKAITFENWLIQKFGRRIYEVFFKTYTEKVWGIPCSQISAEWASKRIKGADAAGIIRHALSLGKKRNIRTLAEKFNFPVLGAGQMYESICDRVTSNGAGLMLNSRVGRFNIAKNKINSIAVVDPAGKEIGISAKHFFSSIPLAHFFKMLSPSDSDEINRAADKLKYRDHVTVNLLVNKRDIFSDQWIYVHAPELKIARVVNFNNFSEAMVENSNKTALSAEFFLFKGAGLWNESDEALAHLAIGDLDKMGILTEGDVEKTWVMRETEVYPVYYIGFQENYDLLKSRIDMISNLYSIGRGGMHKYNNMDHSLMSGILAARNYLGIPDSPYVLWNIDTDSEYLE